MVIGQIGMYICVIGVLASPIAKRAALPFHLIYISVSHCFGFVIVAKLFGQSPFC